MTMVDNDAAYRMGAILAPQQQQPGILGWLQSPQAQGLAQGLLAASQPSPYPVSFGQALGMGMQGANKEQERQFDRKLKELLLQAQISKINKDGEITPYQREYLDLQREMLSRKEEITPYQREKLDLDRDKMNRTTPAQQEEISGKEKGKKDFEALLSAMRDENIALYKGGGMTTSSGGYDYTPDWLSNSVKRLQNSAIGQGLGQAFGTENQSLRNSLESKRTMLSRAVMEATGMSAKQLDSNAELKLFLDSLGSPSHDIESKLEIIKQLSKLYGTGENAQSVDSIKGGQAPAASGEIKFLGFEE